MGYEVARILRLPLDLLLARKLGVPGHEEQAFGAVAAEGGVYLDWEIIRAAHVSSAQITAAIDTTREELRRRAERYRPGAGQPDVLGKAVILVDDGAATGASLMAGLKTLKRLQPAQLVIAVPVGPEAVCALLERDADLVVVLKRPREFYAVGQFYEDFRQLTDEEVVRLLERAKLLKRR